MSFKISDSVTWVGKTDWELRHFHGEDYSTHRGSTYNSYLVRDEKTVLVDTVWEPYADDFIRSLQQEVALEEIDYIVVNHAEVDHSGALPQLMDRIPDTPIYCTQRALDSLQGHYHANWDLRPVKTGDTLKLGEKELVFVEARMLHWPDSMMCYLTGEEILFSSDAFGQHYAAGPLFNDRVDQAELLQECLKYYANILAPFGMLVEKKIQEVLDLELPLEAICPSHGVIWRDNPLQIVELYRQWADSYQEQQATVIYDSMWGGTRKMAEAIAEGLSTTQAPERVKVYNLSRSDSSDVVTEVFRSQLVVVGSPTVNNGILPEVAGFLEKIRGLKLKEKMGAAFGSFGWSGEGAGLIADRLGAAGFEVYEEVKKEKWQPDREVLKECREFGRELGAQL